MRHLLVLKVIMDLAIFKNTLKCRGFIPVVNQTDCSCIFLLQLTGIFSRRDFLLAQKCLQKSVCPLQWMQPKHECLPPPLWDCSWGQNHSCCLLHQISHPSTHSFPRHCLTLNTMPHFYSLHLKSILKLLSKVPILITNILLVPQPQTHHRRFYILQDILFLHIL